MNSNGMFTNSLRKGTMNIKVDVSIVRFSCPPDELLIARAGAKEFQKEVEKHAKVTLTEIHKLNGTPTGIVLLVDWRDSSVAGMSDVDLIYTEAYNMALCEMLTCGYRLPYPKSGDLI